MARARSRGDCRRDRAAATEMFARESARVIGLRSPGRSSTTPGASTTTMSTSARRRATAPGPHPRLHRADDLTQTNLLSSPRGTSVTTPRRWRPSAARAPCRWRRVRPPRPPGPLEIRSRPDDPLARGLCAERVDVNGPCPPRLSPRRPPRPLASTRSRASPASSTSRPSPTFSTPAPRPAPELAALSGVAPRLRPRILPRTRIPREEGDLRDIPSRVSSRTDPRTTPSASANAGAAAARAGRAARSRCSIRRPGRATGRIGARAAARGFADGASARGRRKDFKAERDFAERSVPPWLGEPSADSGCSRETDALRDLERRPRVGARRRARGGARGTRKDRRGGASARGVQIRKRTLRARFRIRRGVDASLGPVHPASTR